MNRGTLALDENAAAALSAAGATLVLNPAAVAQKSGAAFAIGTLVLAGGRLNIDTADGVTDGRLLTVATLDLGAAVTSIGVDAAQYSENQYNPAVPPALNLLDQDGAAAVRLVAAGAVTGSGDITLTGLDGAALSAATAPVVQGAGTVATASYGYAAARRADGIYLGHGLSQIDIHAGRTLVLDNTRAADSTLSALLTGAGSVEINAAGAIVFERQNTHAGATVVSTGTLQLAAAAAIAASASVEVKTGAALDLGGHDQTVQNLAGAGAILLGSATLTAQNTAATTFAGALSGAGRLVKTGAGALTLTGSSAHTGGVELAAGTLAIAHDNALGAGTLALGAPGFPPATLVLATDNLTLANPVTLAASATLTLDTGANAATLAGPISGAGALAIDGAGAVALAGANTFAGGLRVNTARVVAAGRAAAIGAGPVAIAAGSTLEFRDIAAGTVNNTLAGGAVELVNSTLTFGGANTLQRLAINQNAALTAAAAGALGGATADVAVNNGGTLAIAAAGASAKNLTVAPGGRLVFNAVATDRPMLDLAGALTLQAGSTLALGAPLATGRHTLARAAAGITDAGAVFDPGDTGLDLSAFVIDADGSLTVGAVNQAAKRGKDTAAAFDAMTASITAVHARLGESFLNAAAARRAAGPANNFWLKGIGTFGDRAAAAGRVGYKDETRGALAGFDYAVSEKLLLGAYAGFLRVKITTDNQAAAEAGLPHGGAYAVARLGPVYIAGDITLGTFDADTSRFEQTGRATGEYNAYAAAGGLEIGTVLAAWKNAVLRPAAAVRCMSLDYHEQSETGPGAILVDAFKTERWEGLASVQLSQNFATPWKKLPGALDLLLGWRAALKDEEDHLTAAFAGSPEDTFTLIGERYDRGAFLAGLGVHLALTRHSQFSLGYDYETGGGYTRHSVNAIARLAW
ncbi:MAG: autotransporter domain-containing protein [Opitutaceae bacterium]|nr:autotransporter domain-containing protein [Opitutaceae bacterium]